MGATTTKTMPAKTILMLIDAQIRQATNSFYVARGTEDHQKAEAFAEVKWCLAEPKLNIVDEITR